MKKFTIAFLGLLWVMLLVACGGYESTPYPAQRATMDREGFFITLPEEINTIVSIGPSNTEILVELGFGDSIISTDVFSDNIPGIAREISVFDMMSLDVEFLIELNPDIIFITGMTRIYGDADPLSMVSDAGITVVYMPSSVSMDAIMEDIMFMAVVLDVPDAGEAIISYMQAEIDAVQEIADTITTRRTVYFEISPAPDMWTLGSGTFINEMIELVGAVNIFADSYGWMGVSDEVLLETNPDVIITSVGFMDDPVTEIKNRPGWGSMAAVQNGSVFQVSEDYTNRPSHNVIRGLRQIAAAIYPEYFQ